MTYTILVRNNATSQQYFNVYQRQASFGPAGSFTSIYSNSLGCQVVGNYAQTGAQIRFSFDGPVYAAALSTMPAPPPSAFINARSASRQVVTSSLATQSVDISGAGTPANCTNLSVSPLGLSAPAYSAAVPSGSFGINVPSFNPTPNPQLFCGVAMDTTDIGPVLSSYISPAPSSLMTCAPQPKFYVQTGYIPTGQPITANAVNAALCDFTPGYLSYTVIYNANGTFTTEPGP